MRVAAGYRVEVAAAEPEVSDPVDIAFDEEERLWVVEMPDYPLGPAQGERPAGQVSLLSDPDGDGRFTRKSVFAGGLLFPTGVAPWRRGAFVTTMEEVLYFEDADGDGRSDGRKVICGGFSEKNSQLLPNNPTFAFDNWIYVANGLRATDLRAPGEADPLTNTGAASPGGGRLSISGRDFRFHPREGRVEAVSGVSQFGQAFSDGGERFICENRHHLRQVVIAERYAARSPGLALGELVEDCPDHGAAARVHP